MKTVASIELFYENQQELFPEFFETFPYLATRAELDRYGEAGVPWHWHNAVELFYMESGELEYVTPGGTLALPAGSGGLVNSGVLHMTRPLSKSQPNVQLLHLFEPSFLAGPHEGLLAQKYVLPLVSRPDVQLIPIFPDSQEKVELLQALRGSFRLDEGEWGYEFQLRAALSQLWLQVSRLAPEPAKASLPTGNDSRLQVMLAYLYQHYPEKIQVADLAQAAFISQRECYRLFSQCLHCSPVEYLIRYRLQMACRKLVNSQESLTAISQACGFGSSSYFGKLFLRQYGCTPSQYRCRWQDQENLCPK